MPENHPQWDTAIEGDEDQEDSEGSEDSFEEEREKERMHAERGRESVRTRARARESALGSSFYMFSSHWACPMQIGLSQECCST